MEIVFLDKKTVGEVKNFNLLQKLGNVEVFDNTSQADILSRAKGKEVIITNKVHIGREAMNALPELKLICVAATGTNNVDLEYAREKGIEVKNVTSYSTESVAQSTFAMLLHLLNRMTYYDVWVKSGAYSKGSIFTHHGPSFWELSGKRMGIVGLGNIGRRVARISESFGMEVVFYSTTGRNNNIKYKRFDLDTLLGTSDVVTVHAPLSELTLNLINYENIKLMRPCAILLNTGRGGIINEAGLARALNENVIAAAGIDVHKEEPIRPDNPLMRIVNKEKILITPHMAWASIESRSRLIEGIARNIEQYKQDRGAD